MPVELPDARGGSNEVLKALRVRAVHAQELGFALVDIAAILGVCPETVSRWCSKYNQGGPEALPGDRTGRPVGATDGPPKERAELKGKLRRFMQQLSKLPGRIASYFKHKCI